MGIININCIDDNYPVCWVNFLDHVFYNTPDADKAFCIRVDGELVFYNAIHKGSYLQFESEEDCIAFLIKWN